MKSGSETHHKLPLSFSLFRRCNHR